MTPICLRQCIMNKSYETVALDLGLTVNRKRTRAGPSTATAGPGETFSQDPPNIFAGPSGEKNWISFQNGALWCILYFWATAGPPNVAGSGVDNPPTPPSRRAWTRDPEWEAICNTVHGVPISDTHMQRKVCELTFRNAFGFSDTNTCINQTKLRKKTISARIRAYFLVVHKSAAMNWTKLNSTDISAKFSFVQFIPFACSVSCSLSRAS